MSEQQISEIPNDSPVRNLVTAKSIPICDSVCHSKIVIWHKFEHTAGASSMIFWCLLCTLQSLSKRWSMFPCLSPNI